MPDHFYPPVDLATLRNINVIKKLYELHPTYFLESPYAGEVEEFFKNLRGKKSTESVEFNEAAEILDMSGGNKWENLAKEAVTIYNQLKAVKFDAESPNEKIQYFKTISGLLEKLTALQERALGLKSIHEFHKAVMQVMEDTLTSSQRTDVMEKLQAVIDNPKGE